MVSRDDWRITFSLKQTRVEELLVSVVRQHSLIPDPAVCAKPEREYVRQSKVVGKGSRRGLI